MRIGECEVSVRTAWAAAALVLSLGLGAAQAQDKTFVMKVTLPTINDAPHQAAKDFAALVEKNSSGRIKGEVYPASQLGAIPRQIEGVQFGAIQVAEIPPEFFVGVDERFEVMAAPGLVDSIEHAQRVAADPVVRKLMFGIGGNKGLHVAGLFMAQPSSVITKTGIRHLVDFKGKKIRVFASQFQTEAFKRLGATPVAMTLGDVLPALQQGAIDGAIAGIGPYVHLHFNDAAKYVTETNQPAIFLIFAVSQKWYDMLPKDLQEVVDKAGAEVSRSIEPVALKLYQDQRKAWTDAGGELIALPREEQAEMMKTLSSVGDDVSKNKPAVRGAYQIVTDAAKRLRQPPSQ